MCDLLGLGRIPFAHRRRRVGGGLIRERVNLLPRFGQVHLLAGQALNGSGVRLQRPVFFIQLVIILFKLQDLLLKRLKLLALPARGQISVLAEDIMDNERDRHQQQHQDAVAIERGSVKVRIVHGPGSTPRKLAAILPHRMAA